MDDKTEELRDIFLEATGEETVTERQEETPGSLADSGEATRVDARLHELVAAMRERYDFGTDLGDDALVRVVREFFDGADDDALADALGVDAGTAFRARMDLHLVTDADREIAGTDAEAVRERIRAGDDDATVAEAEGVDAGTVARVRRAVEARRETTRANHRFRDEFAELLTDSDLAGRLARGAREDGLREATEDIETDVSF